MHAAVAGAAAAKQGRHERRERRLRLDEGGFQAVRPRGGHAHGPRDAVGFRARGAGARIEDENAAPWVNPHLVDTPLEHAWYGAPDTLRGVFRFRCKTVGGGGGAIDARVPALPLTDACDGWGAPPPDIVGLSI